MEFIVKKLMPRLEPVIILFVVGLLLAVVFPAKAEELCGPVVEVEKVLKDKFGEERHSVAPDVTGTAVVVYTRPDGSTWTMGRMFPDGRLCLFISGTDWQDFQVPGTGA